MPQTRVLKLASEKIQHAYDAQGHSEGWQFLTSPKNTFHKEVEIVFFTPLPLTEYHPEKVFSVSAEQGSIFATEQWGNHAVGRAPLQKQVQAMFRQFARLFYCSGDALLQRSMTAHYIPFRATNIDALHNEAEAHQFAKQLWGDLLPPLNAKIVICIDDLTAADLYKILSGDAIKQAEVETIKLNWGNISAKIYPLGEGASARVLVRLPLLSRFTIFDREKSQSAVNELIAKLHTLLSQQPAAVKSAVQKSSTNVVPVPTANKTTTKANKAKETEAQVTPAATKEKKATISNDGKASLPGKASSPEKASPPEKSAKVSQKEDEKHAAPAATEDVTTKSATTGKQVEQKKNEAVKAQQPDAVDELSQPLADSADNKTPSTTQPLHNSDGLEDEILLTQVSQHTVDARTSDQPEVVKQKTSEKTDSIKQRSEQSEVNPPVAMTKDLTVSSLPTSETKKSDNASSLSQSIAARLEHPCADEPMPENQLYAEEPYSRSALIVTAVEVVIFVLAAVAMIAYVLR